MIRRSPYNIVLTNFLKWLFFKRRNSKQTNSLNFSLEISGLFELLISDFIVLYNNMIWSPLTKFLSFRHGPTLLIFRFDIFPKINIFILYNEIFFPIITEIHVTSNNNKINVFIDIFNHF